MLHSYQYQIVILHLYLKKHWLTIHTILTKKKHKFLLVLLLLYLLHMLLSEVGICTLEMWAIFLQKSQLQQGHTAQPPRLTYPLTERVVWAPQIILQPFLLFPLFSTVFWDLANSRPVHFLMLSSDLFFCLPCLLPPFTVPCKMVLAECDEQETCPYCSSLCLFTMVRRSLCGPIACWILAHTSLVTWSLYEMRSILQ